MLDSLDGILELDVGALELRGILGLLGNLGLLLGALELRAGVRELERSVLNRRLRRVQLVDGVEQLLPGGGEPGQVRRGVVAKLLELRGGFGVAGLGGLGALASLARSLARGLHGDFGHLRRGLLRRGVLLALAHAGGEVLGLRAELNLLRAEELVLRTRLVQGLGGGVELTAERRGFEVRPRNLLGCFFNRGVSSSNLFGEPSAGVGRGRLGVRGVALRRLQGGAQCFLHDVGLGLAGVVRSLRGCLRPDEFVGFRLGGFQPGSKNFHRVGLSL